MNQIFKIFLGVLLCLSLAQPVLAVGLTVEEKGEVLNFVKDYLLLESQNSGIFKLTDLQSGSEQWFELYGILGDIRSMKETHTVIVDADVFGYPDVNYLLYFDVQKKEGRWIMTAKRIGPQHQRDPQE